MSDSPGKTAKITKIKNNAVCLIAIGVFWVVSTILTETACLVKGFIGLPCPACGITRAILALLRGNLRESLHFYPLLLPFAAVMLGGNLLKKHKRLTKILQISLLGMIFAVYAVRMTLLFPHTEPMTVNGHSLLLQIARLV
jgi:uncharacterized membrane protein HdeD (DUF308 family)